MAWCDLGFAIARSITRNIVEDSEIACQFQSALSQFFSIASCLYSVCVSHVVYQVLVDFDYFPDHKIKKFDITVWVKHFFVF